MLIKYEEQEQHFYKFTGNNLRIIILDERLKPIETDLRLTQHMKLLASVLLTFLLQVSFAQETEPIKMDQLQSMITKEINKVKVINFWASWCGPCVKELPYFEALNNNDLLEVSLVSVDFIEDISKADLMLQKKDIKIDSYLLDEKSFVEEIDKSWSGAIPATLIIDTNGKRYFYEKAFSQEELQKLINGILSK